MDLFGIWYIDVPLYKLCILAIDQINNQAYSFVIMFS